MVFTIAKNKVSNEYPCLRYCYSCVFRVPAAVVPFRVALQGRHAVVLFDAVYSSCMRMKYVKAWREDGESSRSLSSRGLCGIREGEM